MQEFLEVLLYILVGLWLFRLIAKWAFPYLLKFFISRVTKKAQKGFREHTQQRSTNDAQSNKQFKSRPKTEKEKVGEYIDFEEID